MFDPDGESWLTAYGRMCVGAPYIFMLHVRAAMRGQVWLVAHGATWPITGAQSRAILQIAKRMGISTDDN